MSIALALGLLAYLPLRAVAYNLDGLQEATAIERATGGSLVDSNHLLFRPVAWLLWRAWASVAPEGTRAIGMLQVLCGVAGALGLALTAYLCLRLTSDLYLTAWATLGLGLSNAYWIYSTDATYMVPASILMTAAMACLVMSWRPPMRDAGCALMLGLALLSFKANVVALPAMLLAPCLLVPRASTTPHRPFRRAVVIVATACAVALVGWLAGSLALLPDPSPRAILRSWTTHGSYLPGWGELSPDHAWDFGQAWLDGVVHTADTAGLSSAQALQYLAVCAWSVLTLATLVRSVHLIARRAQSARPVLWLALALGSYAPFLLWWDPTNPKYQVAMLVFMWPLLAVVWSPAPRPATRLLLLAPVLLIGATNLTTVILPRHRNPTRGQLIARCVAWNTSDTDAVVSLDWRWHHQYVYEQQRSAVLVPGLYGTLHDPLLIKRRIDAFVCSLGDGGRVWMVDPRSMSSDERHWAETRSGLTASEVTDALGDESFTCEGLVLRRVASEGFGTGACNSTLSASPR